MLKNGSITSKMRAVNFQIKGCYIDQIKTGVKVEDYRSLSPGNSKKLCDHIDLKDLLPGQQYVTHNKEVWRLKNDITHVRFFNGYRPDRKELFVELKAIELNQYIKTLPEGMKAGSFAFALILGQIIESKNFK